MKDTCQSFIEWAVANKDKDAGEIIHDFIGIWHLDPSRVEPLHEFLGLTREEYALWLSKPNSLYAIIANKKL